MELLGRALERVGATLKVVATVGLLLIVLGVGELWYGNNEVNFPPFLPTSTVPILGVNIGWDQITVTIISLVATAVSTGSSAPCAWVTPCAASSTTPICCR